MDFYHGARRRPSRHWSWNSRRASGVDLSAAGVTVQPRGGDLLSGHDDLVCSLFTHVLLFLWTQKTLESSIHLELLQIKNAETTTEFLSWRQRLFYSSRCCFLTRCLLPSIHRDVWAVWVVAHVSSQQRLMKPAAACTKWGETSDEVAPFVLFFMFLCLAAIKSLSFSSQQEPGERL